MPKPQPRSIHVKLTNGNAGEYVKVTNITSGGTLRGQVNSQGQVTLNSAASNLNWNNGDVLHISTQGRITQNKKATISSGRASATLGNGATSTIPDVGS